MHPMQDNSDVANLVRRIGRKEENNVVALPGRGVAMPLSAEEALVSWMLDLPDGATISTAARYALRHADAGSDNSPEVERFFRYLRQAVDYAGRMPPSPDRRTRRRGRVRH
ncbi:MAG: hypothetical protein AAGC96_02175 [Pseudomonadota bacterium]